MRLRWSFFLLSLLGQGAIANPVPMYEEGVQRRDPFDAFTSGAKQGREGRNVERRGDDGTLPRGSAPYFSHGVVQRRKVTGEEDPDGYQRILRPKLGRVDADEIAPSPSGSSKESDPASPSSSTSSQSQSLEKRVDYWHVRPSQRTRRTRQGLILLALTALGGLTTWGVLRQKKFEEERKRKKQEEEAAKAKGNGQPPAPAPTPAGAHKP